MEFYNYLKQKSKPKHIKLANLYVECYNAIKALSPFTNKNYVEVLQEKTAELRLLEKQIEECGGTVVSGIVSYKNTAMKKFLKKK